MNTRKLWRIALPAFALATLLLPASAFAAIPYNGYTWDRTGSDIRSVNGYVYKGSIDGVDLPTGPFKNPESLFIAEDDSIYIADTGNSRIIHLDKEHRLIRMYDAKEGPGALNEPKGVFVKADGTMYVADTKNQRIAVFGSDGTFKKEYPAPKDPLLGATFTYSPSKLVLDRRDYMYVVSDGNTQGLMQIDPTGAFRGFYGANHIGFSWKRLLIRLVATDEQKSRLSAVQPAEFSNLDIDSSGFIYTTTLGVQFNQLKRLSPVGVDTLNVGVQREYGDRFTFGPFATATFMGITVDDDGLITALDLQTGKIFQYDKLGNFLFAFGGVGEQNGLFVTPSDLDQRSDGNIYVMDKGRGRIDIFGATSFADLVHEASKLFVDGRYAESEAMWREVLKYSANFDLAYLAIGKSLYKAERYKEAMDYFELANAKPDYSLAFREYRKEYMREHFSYLFVGAILLIAALRFGIPIAVRKLRPYFASAAARRAERGKEEAV